MAINTTKFGRFKFGRGKFGRGVPAQKDEVGEYKTLQSLMQRYPHGFAFKGKNLTAIERAFASVFFEIKKTIIDAAHISPFLKNYVKMQVNKISLPCIEEKLISDGFPNVQLFYTTGEKKYIRPKRPTHTYFGEKNSMFGKDQQEGNNNGEHKAQLGEHNFTKTNPKNFEINKEINGGKIDFLLNNYETPDESAVEIWKIITANRAVWRFIFFVGGQGEFLQPLEFSSYEKYKLFRQKLIETIPFGMFAILNVKVTQKISKG